MDYVIKTHFIENNEFAFEPLYGLVSVIEGSLIALGHLLAASIVTGGPGPCFLAPWVCYCIIDGLDFICSFLPSRVDDGTLYSTTYNEERINLPNIVRKLLFNILY